MTGYARIKVVFTDMDTSGNMDATAQNTVYRDANYPRTNSGDRRVTLISNLGILDTFLAPLGSLSTKEAYNQYYSELSGMSLDDNTIYGSTWIENDLNADYNKLYTFGRKR